MGRWIPVLSCVAVFLLPIWGTVSSIRDAIPYLLQIAGLAAAAVPIWYLFRAR
ncbi:MAG: hypothetical protein JWO25_2900, partial [Alphaproteobacteria bacterium]|nr:hypothetical protein [Alphaproteobacteria bacterium]